MFDNDAPGQKAALACAKVLRPGKAYIATLSRKDPNEHLMANEKGVLRKAIWEASPYRPDGIVHIKDVQVTRHNKEGRKIFTHPFQSLTKATYGRRQGCVDVLTSGSGMGKSTYVREMIYHDLCRGHRVGAIMLE
jgi:twinkle protein